MSKLVATLMATRLVTWTTGLFVAALLIQLVRPARTNPPVDPAKTFRASSHVTEDEARIIDRACGDCHSSNTRWPWYSAVAPVSWLVIDDVDAGRRAMSFSDWADMDPRRKTRRLGDICDEVKQGGMPLFYYLWMHQDARLSDADKDAICGWADRERTAH